MDGELLVFGGSASPGLAREICRDLGVELGRSEVVRFPEGNVFVKVGQNVRGRDVFLVQSTVFPANDQFMELLFWADAFKRASASSVTLVIPYLSYAKGDKKDEPRVSIRARVCADAIEAAGADRVVTLELHAPQIQGFFKIPLDDLQATAVLVDAVREEGLDDLVVVAPDHGYSKKARQFASWLDAPLAIADKRRPDHSSRVQVLDLIGDVADRNALIVDDFTMTAGTLGEVATELMRAGARSVMAAVTHGVFVPGAMERLEASPIRRLLVTDSVENHPLPLSPRVRVVSVAALFAEAIKRIYRRESVSVLFQVPSPRP
jgi:ribose-phosphate pyrophosphokinase